MKTLSVRRRFVLINVEQTANYEAQYKVWPHLGILTVGTVANEEGWDVVLHDELIQGHADLERLIAPGDVVGLSLVVTGIERGIVLARRVKELGARYVVAGNDSAIFRAPQLLRLPGKPIDAVFTSNSLSSVRQFFRRIKMDAIVDINIPGVEVNSDGPVRSNAPDRLAVEIAERKFMKWAGKLDRNDVFVVPKLDLFPDAYWQEVWSNYRSQFGRKYHNPEEVRNALALFAQGCTRTKGTEVCRYCTISGVADIRLPDRGYMVKTVEAYQRFGINTLFNVTDSSYEMGAIPRTLKEIGASFDSMVIYARAQGIAHNPSLLAMWQDVAPGRLLLNVGMDSGDEKMLRHGGNKSSNLLKPLVEENRQAVRRIKDGGAHLHCSFIFGSPGETVDSCKRTREFIEWTIGTLGDQLNICETDFFWLTFGSPASAVFHDYRYADRLAAIAGKKISRQAWHKHFARFSEELVVPPEAQEAWYHFFTQIEHGVAKDYNDEVAKRMAEHTGSIRARAFIPPLL